MMYKKSLEGRVLNKNPASLIGDKIIKLGKLLQQFVGSLLPSSSNNTCIAMA